MPTFKYTIPNEVRSRIPDWFYYALAGEYTAVCGEDVLSPDEYGLSLIEYGSSTADFCEALRAVCRRFRSPTHGATPYYLHLLEENRGESHDE